MIDSAGHLSFILSVHHLLPPVRKCNNVRDPYELPDFWLLNIPDLNTFHYKIWGSKSTRKKDRMWSRRHLIDVWVGVENSVINDSIDQWRRRFYACIRTTGGHFEHSSWDRL